jgi:hypothetical protein
MCGLGLYASGYCKMRNGALHNIVTCQPVVGLRNRALLGSRPVNKIPRSRDDVTHQE